MVSHRQILGALVRVVVFTPLVLVMYLAFTETKAFARATLDGVDPAALVELLVGSPQGILVVVVAVVVAVVSPYLPSRTEMG